MTCMVLVDMTQDLLDTDVLLKDQLEGSQYS